MYKFESKVGFALRVVGNETVEYLARSHDGDRLIVSWKMAHIARDEVGGIGRQCAFKKSVIVGVGADGKFLGGGDVHGKFGHQRQYVACARCVWSENGPREYIEILGHDCVGQTRREDAGSDEIENLRRNADRLERC